MWSIKIYYWQSIKGTNILFSRNKLARDVHYHHHTNTNVRKWIKTYFIFKAASTDLMSLWKKMGDIFQYKLGFLGK